MKIGIVTDSACDLPREILLSRNIASVPLKVIIDNHILEDWRDIHPVRLYERMLNKRSMPRTSPPTIEDFVKIYERYLQHYDVIFSVHLSSYLSYTLAQARIAVETLNANNRIILLDSLSISAGMAEIVLMIADKIAAGVEDIGDIRAEAKRIRDSIVLRYAPASLKWLVAGGRLGTVQATINNVLQLRPLLTLKEGQSARAGMVNRHRTLIAMVTSFEKIFAGSSVNVVFSSAGFMPEVTAEAQELLAQSSLRINRARMQVIGPAIGAHLGPQTIGLLAYPATGDAGYGYDRSAF